MPEKKDKRHLEKAIATASFFTAVTLAFTSMLIRPDNDIASNVMLVIAQFLTLTCTLLGIDYKFSQHIKTVEPHGKENPRAAE